MTAGQHLPLGQAIPDSIHGVSVSIPCMADVIGYEEKKPETLERLKSGYPRFVLHQYLRRLSSYWQELFEKPQYSFWPTSSEKMAKRLQAHLSPLPTKLVKHRGVSAVRLQTESQADTQARSFLQHVGGFLSARQAEDYLLAEGLLQEPQPESSYEGDASQKVIEVLTPHLGVNSDSIFLSNTGMNAFYAAFEAVSEVQGKAGRHSWIKLGWLYTDTMHILDKLSGDNSANIEILDVFDLKGLRSILEEKGTTIAGIVTETPTNPLIQTSDLESIHKLATEHGIYFLVDPTVVSPANVNVEPFSHIIVNSLTKYAANYGDVMLGAVAVTESCPRKAEISATIKAQLEEPYARDLSRLAYQISGYTKLIQITNASTRKVVVFLESHPKVKKVYWAKEEQSKENFEKIARGIDSIGGLISFEFDGPIENFYDAVPLPKGPSFGMSSSLLCPYIYLAHYSLVTTEDGKAILNQAKIHPELLRLAIGEEPVEEIIAALEIGLNS